MGLRAPLEMQRARPLGHPAGLAGRMVVRALSRATSG
jgi:hypothetical protein